MTLLDDQTNPVHVPHRTWRDLPASPPVADLVPPTPPGIPLPAPLGSEDLTSPMPGVAGDGSVGTPPPPPPPPHLAAERVAGCSPRCSPSCSWWLSPAP